MTSDETAESTNLAAVLRRMREATDDDDLEPIAVYRSSYSPDPELVETFAGAAKMYKGKCDKNGNLVAYRLVVQHPRYPDLSATVEYPDEREGVLPGSIKRTLIDNGESPIQAIVEMAKYTQFAVRNPEQAHKGGRPRGVSCKTHEKYTQLANWYQETDLTQQEFCKEADISVTTLQRALKYYRDLRHGNIIPPVPPPEPPENSF
jgi:hypothetical protein